MYILKRSTVTPKHLLKTLELHIKRKNSVNSVSLELIFMQIPRVELEDSVLM